MHRFTFLLRALAVLSLVAFAPAASAQILATPDSDFLDQVKAGRRDDVAKALTRGQSPNTSYASTGQNALMFAASGGYTDIIELLVQHKGNIRIKDKDGNMPLYWGAASGQAEVVELLLKLGAPVNDINRQGSTALMIAARRGHEEAVKVLIGAKANVNLTDHTGRTALMWSAENRNAHVPRMLKEAGAR